MHSGCIAPAELQHIATSVKYCTLLSNNRHLSKSGESREHPSRRYLICFWLAHDKLWIALPLPTLTPSSLAQAYLASHVQADYFDTMDGGTLESCVFLKPEIASAVALRRSMWLGVDLTQARIGSMAWEPQRSGTL